MAAATVEFDYFGGNASEPAGVSAESGWRFTLADAQNSTTAPVAIPGSTGQNFSWYFLFAFKVTGAGGTLSNFCIKLNSALTTGIRVYFKALAAYAQPTGANKPADDGASNSTAPSGYTAMTTSAQQWYAGPVSAGTTGRKGDFCQMCAGVGYDYVGGGNGNLAIPNMTAYYDES